VSTRALTTRQRDALEALVNYIDEHDYAPTIRELQELLGLASPAPVQDLLAKLRDKGYVTWDPGRGRTLRLVK